MSIRVVLIGQGDVAQILGGKQVEAPDVLMAGNPPDVGAWKPGEPLPHMRFEDPPGGMCPDHYRDAVVGVAREADDVEDFTAALLDSLGLDLISSHMVPPDVAEQAVVRWAAELYAQYGHADPE